LREYRAGKSNISDILYSRGSPEFLYTLSNELRAAANGVGLRSLSTSSFEIKDRAVSLTEPHVGRRAGQHTNVSPGQIVGYNVTMQRAYIQFGCGLCAPSGWRNFDAGPVFWVQKHTSVLNSVFRSKGFPIYPVNNIEYANVVLGLPVPPQSADGVYCSHVLEHLTLAEFRTAIRNVRQYLKPGGAFRLVVPDLEFMINRYNSTADPSAAMKLMEETILGVKNGHRGLRAAGQLLFGRSRHMWMWDYKAMAHELEQAGFVNIRRAYFNDSVDPRFQEVEDGGRWENALGVECITPS
jgi:hypothetical protein